MICFLTAFAKGSNVIADENILAEKHRGVNNSDTKFTFVIDPGHGGIDGGAVGTTGSLEKDINLSVSGILSDLMVIMGYTAVMTRNDDRLLGEEGSGNRKLEDLRSRVDFVKDYENPLFVSIHMNKFPQEYCHGLTVYYSGNFEESELLALSVKESVINHLQPDNKRPMKKATSALYVLDRATVPAILIECGFLSNIEEEKKLLDDDYQKKLVMAIASGLSEFAKDK